MASMLPEGEVTTFEDQEYVNPEASLNEQNAFIDNLRSTQTQRSQEIQTQTHDLGTDVPSNLGGLTGGQGYWTSRYQTPQTNSVVADLRATAQAQALTQALQNQQSMWKKRYNDAYSAAQKRAAARANSGNYTTATPSQPEQPEIKGGVDETPTSANKGSSSTGYNWGPEDFAKYGSGATVLPGAIPGTYDVYTKDGQHFVEDTRGEQSGNTGVGQNGNYPDAGAWLNAQLNGVQDWFDKLFSGQDPTLEARKNAFGTGGQQR